MTTKLKKMEKVYHLVFTNPVARFYYQGNHSHPVRRTILVIDERLDSLIGYELREGSTVRSFTQARKKLKSYNKEEIAYWGDYSRLRQSSRTAKKRSATTTLERYPITDLLVNGI